MRSNYVRLMSNFLTSNFPISCILVIFNRVRCILTCSKIFSLKSIETTEVKSFSLNKLKMKTITSRLAYYQNRLDSNLCVSVCNLWSLCICVCSCVPSAANKLRVREVQVWECLMYSGGATEPPA